MVTVTDFRLLFKFFFPFKSGRLWPNVLFTFWNSITVRLFVHWISTLIAFGLARHEMIVASIKGQILSLPFHSLLICINSLPKPASTTKLRFDFAGFGSASVSFSIRFNYNLIIGPIRRRKPFSFSLRWMAPVGPTQRSTVSLYTSISFVRCTFSLQSVQRTFASLCPSIIISKFITIHVDLLDHATCCLVFRFFRFIFFYLIFFLF